MSLPACLAPNNAASPKGSDGHLHLCSEGALLSISRTRKEDTHRVTPALPPPAGPAHQEIAPQHSLTCRVGNGKRVQHSTRELRPWKSIEGATTLPTAHGAPSTYPLPSARNWGDTRVWRGSAAFVGTTSSRVICRCATPEVPQMQHFGLSTSEGQ